ncbi:hypothetical protein Leryth_006420 [Lithospermum erythrorhizon]|nr:hypothetical protein Leryth_006420 [Lithospermum erythrorhizon]
MENSFGVQQMKAFGWAARDASGVLSPFNFFRRATGKNDVQLKVMYCGICRTDLHLIKNDFGLSTFPLVPGHEIVGIVTEVGTNVKKLQVGDRVAVGALTGSCCSCNNCANNLENYCTQFVPTTSGYQPNGEKSSNFGGFSNIMVCDAHFVLRIPENLDLDAAAPLLCAGITTYSPLRYFGLDKPGMHIGVNGLGGLGHIAVKFAKAFGVRVTVISTSPKKEMEALEYLGADSFLLSTNPDHFQAAQGTLDGILDTVYANHPIQPLIDLLKPNGKLVFLGTFEKITNLITFL